MSAPATFSIADQIACVRRKIAMRERVYPKWVSAGRMHQSAADREIATMRAVLWTLETMAEYRDRTLEEAANIAANSCLVPPDGGSPSREEVEAADAAAAAIRAAKFASSSGRGGVQLKPAGGSHDAVARINAAREAAHKERAQ